MIIDVKVYASSGKTGWKLDKNGTLKVYLKSPAQRGLANKELIKTLAHALNIPQISLKIISGQTIPKKRLKIDAQLSYQDIIRKLGLDCQETIFDNKD